MNIYFQAFYSYALSTFKESILSTLNAHQKKICMAASIAFGFLAACYLASRYCFNSKDQQKVDDVAKDILINFDTQVRNGYGEYIAFRRNEEGCKTPLNQADFQKAYAILDEYMPNKLTSEQYASRHFDILSRVKKEISSDCDIAFIPRTLYELILIRHCLKEEKSCGLGCDIHELNRDILKNRKSVKITDDEIKFVFYSVSKKNIKANIKKNKCWHRCHFSDWGDNQHPDVIKIAYKLHKEILKNPLFQAQKEMTYQQLKSFAEEELRNIHSLNAENVGCSIRNQEDDNLILKALALECGAVAQRSIILYRGAKFAKDECYDKSNSAVPYSLSYGTGLFAGYLYESKTSGAMAFDYMRQKANDAYALVISVDDFYTSSFYIPPTNTICQFAGFGETFHARSKAWKNAKPMQGFQQPPDRVDHLFSNFTQSSFIENFKTHKQQAVFLK